LPEFCTFPPLDSAFLDVLGVLRASAVSRRSFQISNFQFEMPVVDFPFFDFPVSPATFRHAQKRTF